MNMTQAYNEKAVLRDVDYSLYQDVTVLAANEITDLEGLEEGDIVIDLIEEY